jgi:hypothetical protein
MCLPDSKTAVRAREMIRKENPLDPFLAALKPSSVPKGEDFWEDKSKPFDADSLLSEDSTKSSTKEF